MKTKLYRDLAGMFIAAAVALTTVAPKAAFADADGDDEKTRVALKQVDREQSDLDDDPFMHEPVYQPAFIQLDRVDDTEPSATTSYVLFGVSGAAIASAVVFGVLTSRATGDADEQCGDSVCLGSARGALDREQRYALATDISAGVALVSGGAGLYYWLRARREKKRWLSAKNSVQPTAVPGGLGVSFSGSF